MLCAKANIIAGLKKELMTLQGIRPALDNALLNERLGPIKTAFVNQSFPLGAIHELISSSHEDIACSSGFLSAIISVLMQKKGVSIWISLNEQWFPPAFNAYGIDAGQIIFIRAPKEKDIAWITEEALSSEAVAAVVSEMKDMSFTTSRRLQLTVEKSKVTGFIIRTDPKQIHATSSMARWKISSLPGYIPTGLPGVGFPVWNVELLKARNAKPASWQVQYSNGCFRNLLQISNRKSQIENHYSIPKKTG